MENSTKVRTIKSLTRDIANEKINFNHLVQRQSNQWNKKQKELLIDSLLQGIVLPQLVFAINDNDNYCIDGKQRLTTIYNFINSKEYEKLTEDEKDKILSAEVSTITYSNLSDDDIFELFKRYNNGVTLSGGQKTRSYCDKEILTLIKSTIENNSIKEVWNITKGQKNKNEDEMVIFQAMMLLSDFEFKNFSNKEVERFLQETSVEELKNVFEEVKNKLDITYNTIKDNLGEEKQKNLKKIHLPMIISAATNEDTFKNKLINFLENYNSDNTEFAEYRSHCQTGTSQKEHVVGRLSYWNN